MAITVKDVLIRTTAVRLAIPERIVESVVTHQFSSAATAMDTNKSVEISGFGKFMFNEKKAKLRLEKMERWAKDLQSQVDSPETMIRSEKWTLAALENVNKVINELKPIVTK